MKALQIANCKLQIANLKPILSGGEVKKMFDALLILTILAAVATVLVVGLAVSDRLKKKQGGAKAGDRTP
jgi:hypothetical protein